jgi:cytochrome c peroxidase
MRIALALAVVIPLGLDLYLPVPRDNPLTAEKIETGFKTPTLRDVARTAPYMHYGSLATLEAVMELYDRGGTSNPNLETNIRPHLAPAEKRALIAFLHALSGDLTAGAGR